MLIGTSWHIKSFLKSREKINPDRDCYLKRTDLMELKSPVPPPHRNKSCILLPFSLVSFSLLLVEAQRARFKARVVLV